MAHAVEKLYLADDPDQCNPQLNLNPLHGCRLFDLPGSPEGGEPRSSLR